MASHELCDRLEKLSRVRKDELPARIKNPMTGKMIKTDGRTFTTLMNACTKGCGVGKDACDKARKNHRVNPLTGRPLKKKSAVRKLIIKGCDSCDAKMRRDATKEKERRARIAAKAHARIEEWKERSVSSMRQKRDKKGETLKQVHSKLQNIFQKQAAAKTAKHIGKVLSMKAVKARAAVATRKRSEKLKAKRGVEYLEAEEVEYILKDGLFDGHLPQNVVPVVIDMTQGGGIYQIRRHFSKRNGGLAVVYNNEHFVAIGIDIDPDTGLYTINYYEPFDHVFPSFVKAFESALAQLNKGQVTGHLHRYPLNWQKQGGPCGVYAAMAVKALAIGYDLSKVQVRKELEPRLSDVKDFYDWLSQNLARLKK
jgi:hypothetical protein